MQSLVPRAIPIIEFGAKGDNCAVAKYKKNKTKWQSFGKLFTYPEVLFPVLEHFQGQNLRENPRAYTRAKPLQSFEAI